MIFDGYNRNKLQTAVYSDAANGMGKWPSEGIDVYMLSNGWAYANKKFLSVTNHGDLSAKIKSYFDTELGSLEDSATFQAVVSKLSLPAEDILFCTHSGMEGVAAHKAGLSVILIETHREDVARERTDATIRCGLPLIRIFSDLSFGHDAPVASSMVDEEAMSKAVEASKASKAGGSSAAPSRSSSKGGSSSGLSGSKSSGSVGSRKSSGTRSSSSRGSSAASSGSRTSGSSASGSASSGSRGSSASASRGSSGTSGGSSGSQGSSSHGSSSKGSSSKGSSAHGSSSKGSSSKGSSSSK